MTTIILSLIMMAGLFLMLYAGVGLIQDRKIFTSAPKEVQEAVLPRNERFPGAHLLGWLFAAAAVLLMTGAVIYGARDAALNHFTFGQSFARFLVMLLLLKAFDIGFFDWFLLCNKGFGFFQRFYPEVGKVLSRQLFGYNWKTHLCHILASPLIAAVLAWICSLF
ncbi:MAG: hypothetical protein E7185_12340 [Erysipelotrichaceae bacterium]|nr:hypothetical protein [Erysipelotrichaceae bacterium]